MIMIIIVRFYDEYLEFGIKMKRYAKSSRNYGALVYYFHVTLQDNEKKVKGVSKH